MEKWKETSRARDQLYHLKVAWRQFEAQHQPKRRTSELRQVLEIIQSVLDNACDAFAGGRIMEVLVNQYSPNPLPGFAPEPPPHLQEEFAGCVKAMQEGREVKISPPMQEWLSELLDQGIDPF